MDYQRYPFDLPAERGAVRINFRTSSVGFAQVHPDKSFRERDTRNTTGSVLNFSSMLREFELHRGTRISRTPTRRTGGGG